ncbi:MAG: hypothetical protein A4S14_05470 [Proteobacteria bacterium SG_bin9]|nr:MAG: hypothetical protein A4S14_05470 [Proteobacteria bacterium SG_bin9]
MFGIYIFLAAKLVYRVHNGSSGSLKFGPVPEVALFVVLSLVAIIVCVTFVVVRYLAPRIQHAISRVIARATE